MFLSSSQTLSLDALNGFTGTLAVTVDYADVATTGATLIPAPSSVVDAAPSNLTVICASPATGYVRQVKAITLNNSGIDDAQITILFNSGVSTYIQWSGIVPAGFSVSYTYENGWNPMGAPNAVTYPIREFDNLGGAQVIYAGAAAPGTALSAAAWQIAKYGYDTNGNLTSVLYAEGSNTFSNVWNNRTSYSYS